jgi:hypothetical protein
LRPSLLRSIEETKLPELLQTVIYRRRVELFRSAQSWIFAQGVRDLGSREPAPAPEQREDFGERLTQRHSPGAFAGGAWYFALHQGAELLTASREAQAKSCV